MSSIQLVSVQIGGGCCFSGDSTFPLSPHSLDGNELGDEGVISLCEGLKSCTSLQMLK